MKASPAFGRRRLHTKTDYIDCPALFCFFFSSFFFFLFFFMLTFEMVREAKQNWPKSKLAEVEFGRSRNWPKSKLAEVEIGRSRTGRTRKKNWPKSKLAEVDHDPLARPALANSYLTNVSCLVCSFPFFVFLSSSSSSSSSCSSFSFSCLFVLCPLNLNPKTLEP